MAVAVTQARTPGQRYGDDTGAFSNFLKGDTLQIVGVDNASVDMPTLYGPGLVVGRLDLVTAAGSNANDFDLPAGIHKQELLVVLKTKTGGNATVTPAAGVAIANAAGAVAGITFSAAAKYALLRYEYNAWMVVRTDATVA